MGWKLGSLEKRTRSAPNIYKHPPMHTTNTPSDEPHPRMGDKKRMGEEGGMAIGETGCGCRQPEKAPIS